VTGHHRGLQQKHRAGYRALSQNPRAMCRLSYLCLLDVVDCNTRHMFHRRGSICFLQAMSVFDIRASSSSPRLPLGQILFLWHPPLLS